MAVITVDVVFVGVVLLVAVVVQVVAVTVTSHSINSRSLFTCGVSSVSGVSQVKAEGSFTWSLQFFLFKHRDVKNKPANRASGESRHLQTNTTSP